jgi:hypothetical protein
MRIEKPIEEMTCKPHLYSTTYFKVFLVIVDSGESGPYNHTLKKDLKPFEYHPKKRKL